MKKVQSRASAASDAFNRLESNFPFGGAVAFRIRHLHLRPRFDFPWEGLNFSNSEANGADSASWAIPSSAGIHCGESAGDNSVDWLIPYGQESISGAIVSLGTAGRPQTDRNSGGARGIS